MFSRFSGEEVETYLSRLNAQLKRLPPEDRAELHQELRQHLESLAAAHEELGATRDEAVRAALSQFGDPRKFGKRMFREWQRSRPSRINSLILTCLCASGLLFMGWLWSCLQSPDASGGPFLEYGIPLMAGTMTGLLLPRQAPHGAALAATFAVPAIGLGIGHTGHAAWLSGLVNDNEWMARLAVDWLTIGAASAWAAGRLRRERTPSPGSQIAP